MGCHEFIYMDIGGLNGFWVAGGEIEGRLENGNAFQVEKSCCQ